MSYELWSLEDLVKHLETDGKSNQETSREKISKRNGTEEKTV